MDLQEEFSILSTAGTPTSASSCCFWLASQASNWTSCWTLSVGHTRVGAGGQAAALPTQPSPGSTLQWDPGTQGPRAKIQPMHHRVPSPQGAAYPSIPGQQHTQPALHDPHILASPCWFYTWALWTVHPQPNLSCASKQPRRGLGSPGKMKWCELACQRLNQRTSQANAISTAKSSFPSRGSWTLQCKKVSVLGSSATLLFLTWGILRQEVRVLWTSNSQDESVELSPASRQHLPASKRKCEMKKGCLSVENNDKCRGFYCSLQWLRWHFFFPADGKAYLATPSLAYQMLQWCILKFLLRKIGITFIFCIRRVNTKRSSKSNFH